ARRRLLLARRTPRSGPARVGNLPRRTGCFPSPSCGGCRMLAPARALHLSRSMERFFARDRCVPELVASAAADHGDALAVAAEGRALTYRDVDTRANRLAHELRAAGVGREVVVGLCGHRSPELVVGAL